ncbi:kelch-like protein 10 isoform X2 [Brienomyrus brachyistius]|uniref:kelch-like protein 10 isoform X2 n=1 Tax=Brienomyrus brachyistius TaxID=42636 RepID=UPI0020B29B40|nr:kelch-like protein 10 isoform X2 [Brienomyrus brachyistius]
MFTGAWNIPGMYEYKFPNISPETMKHIIECFTGAWNIPGMYEYEFPNISLTRTLCSSQYIDSVEILLAAADELNILGIVKRCSDFLLKQLCLENCVGLFKIADIHCLNELHQSAFNTILKNFKEVAGTLEESPELTLQQLCNIIEKDELNVRQEDVVFGVILRWIKHEPASRKAHLSVLLPKVRMARMTPEHFIKTVKNNDLVKADVACRPIVSEVLKAIYELDFKSPSSDFDNPLIRPRLPSEILLAIGGWRHHPTNWIEAYDSWADRWVDATQEEMPPVSFHGTAYLKGHVYCIGGYDGLSCISTVRRFDPMTRTWQRVAPMNSRRCYVSVAVLDGFIYAMGGLNGSRRINTVERYNPDTDQWTVIQPLNERRSHASATALHGKIYICGGYNGTDSLSSAECYDPFTDQWTAITPMSTARNGVGVVAYKEKIYAVGGTNGSHHLRSVEAYDPLSNRWNAVAPMFMSRSNFGIEVIDGLLFVMGGTDGFSVSSRVECYDAETGSWYSAQNMCTPNKNFSCCVVPAHPAIMQYAAPR